MAYGKSLIPKMMGELATYGFTCHTVTGDGKIRGHSITEMWIDEVPNVGTIGQVPEPRLSFLAKCVRQRFGISSDLTIKTNSLFLL